MSKKYLVIASLLITVVAAAILSHHVDIHRLLLLLHGG